MDPFFLPLPLMYPTVSEHQDRLAFQQLEQYLDVALCLLRTTAERLLAAAGPQALGPELLAFLEGNDPVEQSRLVAQIDALLKQKSESEAVRSCRERLGVTWDQAFELRACWPRWDQTRKFRCLQMTELRKLFASIKVDPLVQINKLPPITP